MPKVLIIEDDVAYRKVYTRKFEVADFTVETADNGAAGLEKMRVFKPDIVFTDLMMPILDGFQVLNAMAADETLSKIPVVVTTNLSTAEDAQKVIEKGARALLVKSDTEPQSVVDKALEILGTKSA
jgi:CheY-like chemotaxis protein